MKHYYQTTPLESDEALEAQGRAISQEDRILAFMINYRPAAFTAWEINDRFPEFEITSCRRALFNLEKQGKIVQNGFADGPKGKPCGKYLVYSGKLF